MNEKAQFDFTALVALCLVGGVIHWLSNIFFGSMYEGAAEVAFYGDLFDGMLVTVFTPLLGSDWPEMNPLQGGLERSLRYSLFLLTLGLGILWGMERFRGKVDSLSFQIWLLLGVPFLCAFIPAAITGAGGIGGPFMAYWGFLGFSISLIFFGLLARESKLYRFTINRRLILVMAGALILFYLSSRGVDAYESWAKGAERIGISRSPDLFWGVFVTFLHQAFIFFVLILAPTLWLWRNFFHQFESSEELREEIEEEPQEELL